MRRMRKRELRGLNHGLTPTCVHEFEHIIQVLGPDVLEVDDHPGLGARGQDVLEELAA